MIDATKIFYQNFQNDNRKVYQNNLKNNDHKNDKLIKKSFSCFNIKIVKHNNNFN